MNAPVIGIDVGGPTKGYHAVALVDRQLRTFKSADPRAIAGWCGDIGAAVIAVDAPCRWSISERTRPAERALKSLGIGCFSTPPRSIAALHPKNHYGWMFAGEALFNLLAGEWPLYNGITGKGKATLETFPHAVVCTRAGKPVSAKNKAQVRRSVLSQWGLDAAKLSNIDFVDAGLCAIAAESFLTERTTQFGNAETGFIVVPSQGYART